MCPTYKAVKSQAKTNTNLNGLRDTYNMAKFTVEWLSQSYYSSRQEEDNRALESKVNGDPSQYPPASPNNSCGYSSASEGSDVGDESEGESGRRIRTKFSSEQIRKLESTFSKHRYLGASQRRKIAEKLTLSETQVKTWFQNRRMKLKREAQDMRTEFLAVPAELMPPMMFQHHALSGQLPGVNRGLYPLQELRRAATHPAMPRHHPYQPYPTLQTLPREDHRRVPFRPQDFTLILF